MITVRIPPRLRPFLSFANVASTPMKRPQQVPNTAGPLCNSPVEGDGCSGRRTETYRGIMWVSPVISSERIVMCLGNVPEVRGFWLTWPFGLRIRCENCMLEVVTSDEEEGVRGTGTSREKSAQNNGRAQKFHHGRRARTVVDDAAKVTIGDRRQLAI